jgi:hypothetical protein
MEESDTYLMILDQGEERGLREAILVQAEDRFGPLDASVKAGLQNITDLKRLKRIIRQTPKAVNWQEILDTP